MNNTTEDFGRYINIGQGILYITFLSILISCSIKPKKNEDYNSFNSKRIVKKISFSETPKWLKVYVDGESLKDTSNTLGSYQNPFPSIQSAVDHLSGYGEVIVRAGVYRESVVIKNNKNYNKTNLSILSQKNHSSIIDGTETLEFNWTKVSYCSNVWKAKIDKSFLERNSDFFYPNNSNRKIIKNAKKKEIQKQIKLKKTIIIHNDENFDQYASIKQLCGKEMGFVIDETDSTLYLSLKIDKDPNQSELHTAVRNFAFKLDKSITNNVKISGFVVRNIADRWPLPPGGAIRINNCDSCLVENNIITNVNGSAIVAARTSNSTIRKNKIYRAGISGIAAPYAPSNLIIEYNHIENSCIHDVFRLHESAAIKLHQSKGSVIRNNFLQNILNGSGIWLDYNCDDNMIYENTLVNVNTNLGAVFIEASPSPCTNTIERNIFKKIDGAAIHSRVTDSIKILNNLIIESKIPIKLSIGNRSRLVKGRAAKNKGHIICNNIIDNMNAFDMSLGEEPSFYNNTVSDQWDFDLKNHRYLKENTIHKLNISKSDSTVELRKEDFTNTKNSNDTLYNTQNKGPINIDSELTYYEIHLKKWNR